MMRLTINGIKMKLLSMKIVKRMFTIERIIEIKKNIAVFLSTISKFFLRFIVIICSTTSKSNYIAPLSPLKI